MQTRSASPVQPETPDARPRVGIESPWSSAVETELRVRAESSRNFWKSRAGELEEELRRVRATLDGTNCLQFMDRKGSQFRRESQVLRDKLRARYDKRNWAELCISALAAQREGEIDYTCDVRDCVAFRSALKEIHRQRDEECKEHLEQHAFRIEKQMLLKMAQRRSNRKLSWENSLWKFDHSARDANGDPVRRREMMAKDSIVRAPEIYNPKAVLTKIREEEVDASGQDRHVESEDRKGAQVRDVWRRRSSR